MRRIRNKQKMVGGEKLHEEMNAYFFYIDVEEDSEEQPTPELNDNVRRTVRCTDPYRLFRKTDFVI